MYSTNESLKTPFFAIPSYVSNIKHTPFNIKYARFNSQSIGNTSEICHTKHNTQKFYKYLF